MAFGWRPTPSTRRACERKDAAQDHLDAHGLYFARHEEHGRRGSYGGHVISFEVVHDLGHGIETLLQRERVGVVLRADVVGRLLRRF